MNATSAPASSSLNNWQKSRLQVRRVWALSLPYFQSEEKWQARGLLAACVALNLGLVYLMVLLNDWNRVFYDALQNRDADVFWKQLGVFGLLATIFIVVAVYRFYLTQLLELRWRAWMTNDYLQRWLSHPVFYQLELKAQQGTDNPDQRIQEDVQQFTADTVGLSLGLLDASVTLLSFVGILWSLSGGFAFTLGGASFDIPGFMVWAALLYALSGSWLGHWLGKSMASLNFAQQRYEADFRHHLMRVREYSDAIALDRGGAVERSALLSRFQHVLQNFMRLLRVQKRYTWFSSGYGQAAVVFPMLVASPRYFSGAIQLGELMQISSAFGQVQESLSWFISNYSRLAAWQATTLRLTTFQDQMQALSLSNDRRTHAAQNDADRHAAPSEATQNAIHIQALTLCLPNGAALLRDTPLHIQAGDAILVRGPSGCGKSTLFRALAGIWPHAQTQAPNEWPLTLPEHTVFMPQRPYFPQGTLRQALTYPNATQAFDDAQLQQALVDALLPQWVDQLDTEGQWTQQLSGGEQQRLAIARVLLKRPRWLFADEITSALDAHAEQVLYKKLLQMVRQQQGALVSIAHREAVAAFHTSLWVFTPQSADSPDAQTMADPFGLPAAFTLSSVANP